MEKVTLKVSELSGVALDWAVALCEVGPIDIKDIDDPHFYSTDWAQGGPIIERESISLACRPKDARGLWCAVLGPNRFLSPDFEGYGPTPLISAMRCYVASKLGGEVDIPLPLIG